MESSPDKTSKSVKVAPPRLELPPDDSSTHIDSPVSDQGTVVDGGLLETGLLERRPSLLVNPKLRQTFAYKGTTWKLDIIAGVVIIFAAVIVIIIGFVLDAINGHQKAHYFAVAGGIVLLIGLAFMCRAICWWCRNDGAKGESHLPSMAQRSNYESCAVMPEPAAV